MTNEIIINEKATATAKGTKRNKNAKPVMCIETGEIFTSATDAGIAYGVGVDCISVNCLGKTKTCKGKHFCYLDQMPEHIDNVANYIQTIVHKAKLYDEMMAEKEKKSRLQAELAKAKEAYDKLVDKLEAEAMRIINAEKELEALDSLCIA